MTEQKTPEQIVAAAMSGGNRAYSTHDLQVMAVVAALREAGMLVEPEWEWECRFPPFDFRACAGDHWLHAKPVESRRRRPAGPWIEVPSE